MNQSIKKQHIHYIYYTHRSYHSLPPSFQTLQCLANSVRSKMIPYDGNDIAITMTMILSTLVAILVGLIYIQDKTSDPKTQEASTFFPCPKRQPSKYAYEKFCAFYSPIWMGVFVVIVAFQLYEDFTATTYNVVLLGIAMPFVLQPIIFPSAGFNSPDTKRPLFERYSTKANLWLCVYSFIGNYWYVPFLSCCMMI